MGTSEKLKRGRGDSSLKLNGEGEQEGGDSFFLPLFFNNLREKTKVFKKIRLDFYKKFRIFVTNTSCGRTIYSVFAIPGSSESCGAQLHH